jgi:hypothetical protein
MARANLFPDTTQPGAGRLEEEETKSPVGRLRVAPASYEGGPMAKSALLKRNLLRSEAGHLSEKHKDTSIEEEEEEERPF